MLETDCGCLERGWPERAEVEVSHGVVTLVCAECGRLRRWRLGKQVSGPRPRRLCEHCGRLFERGRSDQVYCGDTCRKRALRARGAES